MSMEEDIDLANILLDEEMNLSSPSDIDLSNETKSFVKRPKPLLKCVVCSDNAFGYNFDAISCESCKAFFRRNALRPPGRLKCRGAGHCEVTVETRKRCKKCRLEKCFRMGMRKEWILSDEEKRRKKSKIEENRHNKQVEGNVHHRVRRRQLTTSKTDHSSSGDGPSPVITTDNSIAVSPMTELDWSKVQLIQKAYSDAMAFNRVVGVPLYPAIHQINSTTDLIQVPTYLSSIRLITYLKRIPEFDQFDPEDRVTLVKHNLLAVVFLHTVLIYDPIGDTYHEYNTEDPIFEGKDWIRVLGEDRYHELTTTAKNLIEVIEYDRVIAKFLLIITLFTKAFCGYDIIHEPSLNHPMFVFNSQNIYIETLYKYCIHQYGLTRTVTLFTRLINQLFAVQRLAIHLKDFVHSENSEIHASQLSPLMQSVLQLTN